MDKSATSTSSDDTTLLTEREAIRALMEVIAQSQVLEMPIESPSDLDRTFPLYGDGSKKPRPSDLRVASLTGWLTAKWGIRPA